MSCEHDCPRPPQFPKTIQNRPGLPRIDYRIGTYADMREYMFDLLNKATALAAWTHRGPDDPGIALVECAAVVGDILTFYQSLYANELYLRTAQWRESVTELVRLLGYRLAPGLGGDAVFALAVKGDQPVTVPKDFGLKAQIEGQDKPAEFESTEETVAYPHLSQFRLYKPFQNPGPAIGALNREFALSLPEGGKPEIELKEYDRLLIGTPQPSELDPTRLENAEVLIVEETREEFGQLIVKTKGGAVRNVGASSLAAFKLGGTYRHFGHNAPPDKITLITSTTPASLSKSSVDYKRYLLTEYLRGFYGDLPYEQIDPVVARLEMPLAAEVDIFGAGGQVLIEMVLQFYNYDFDLYGDPQRYLLLGRIAAVENRSMTIGNLTASGTVLTLEEDMLVLAGLDPNDTMLYASTDIRGVSIYEVKGERLGLRPKPEYVTATTGVEIAYYGTAEQVNVLPDRSLMLVDEDGIVNIVNVTGLATGALDQPEEVRHRTILLDTPVDYSQFLHPDTEVDVYGNLVAATQGKTQQEVVLGTGDNRQAFQTFSLPKAPLTYLLDETQTPPQVPELIVYVDGIEWKRVETFFTAGPEDHVYVVREDSDKSYVQFGDGKTGARLSSGIKNVRAVYRVGSGAYGPLKAGTNPQATGKLANLDKPFLPAPVTGGSQPEDENNARVAAPGKMQSLGRMVSLSDIEAEATAIPNVIKVRAVWTAPEGVPLVRLTVLTQSGDPADLDAVRLSLQTANRCHGPARFPIDAVQGVRQYCYLRFEVGFDPSRLEADILAAIKAALGLSGEEGNGIDGSEGLFGLKTRQFGQGAYASQIIAAVQNVAGVRWVKLIAAENLDLGEPPETDPAQLVLPSVDVVNQVLACPEDRLLALYTGHLILSLSKDEVAQECAS